MNATKTRPGIGALLVLMAAGLALLLSLAPAWALPPGGAGDSTEGTDSSVTPSVQAGGTIGFSLTGFPPGEVVYIKIDDGALAGGDASVQGQGVVHSQVIGPDGTVAGSFVLPSYVPAGQHWLRFLASQPRQGHGGGVIGFTNRSPEFTVLAPGSAPAPAAGQAGGGSAAEGGQGGNVGGAETQPGGQAAQAQTAEGQEAPDQAALGSFGQASPAPSASASAAPSAAPTTTQSAAPSAANSAAAAPAQAAQPAPAAAPAANQFPVVGVVVLALSVLVVGSGLAAIVVRKRNQGPGSSARQ
ncbi:MAG: hypothetical protein Q3999_01390 [Buchananella hordeovulneris]|nr:hypothetical protein [Buchananella hordeovulneris]